MTEPVAYLNGEWIPASRMAIAVTDSGFLLGVTIAEQLRTFRGRLFRLDLHLERLRHSLDIVGFDAGVTLEELAELAETLATRNHALLTDGDDLGLTIFVTPGPYATYAQGNEGPTLGLHTYPLPYRLWVHQYQHGQALTVTHTRQVPPQCWPPSLKCRSRMHYFLADREAREREPQSRALLLDMDGHVTESSTANVVLWRSDEGLLSPTAEQVLPGVSLATLRELAASLQIPFHSRVLTVDDVYSADEAFLTSTSPCIVPVASCDGVRLRGGAPGPMYQRLMNAWSERVQVDIRDQAMRFAERS